MKCPKCGKDIPDDSIYCGYCSTQIGRKKRGINLEAIIGVLIAAIAACTVILFLRKGGSTVAITDLRSKSTVQSVDNGDVPNDNGTTLSVTEDNELTDSNKVEELTATPTPEPTATPTPEPTATPTPEPVEIITVIGGVQAPATDFIFPHSSWEVLSRDQLDTMISSDRDTMHSTSQMAINEMFARYGYTFGTSTNTAREAKNYFESLDWYQSAQTYCSAPNWETVRKEYMNDVERENINRINAWQQEHGVYY